jgi:hypothetical protein
MRPGSTGQWPVLKPKRALPAGRGIGQSGLRRLLDGFVLKLGIVDQTHDRLLDERGGAGGQALRHVPVDYTLKLVRALDRTHVNL